MIFEVLLLIIYIFELGGFPAKLLFSAAGESGGYYLNSPLNLLRNLARLV